jgi:peptidoglycan/LPS O-acetylase OafA/YrhL
MMFKRMQRIPTLDGWRGVAILLVLLDHFMPFRRGQPLAPWLCLGQHGVTVFFVLSGYLITKKLAEEYSQTGRVGFQRFYVQRIRRLMPCAWGYLLFVWASLSLWEFASSVLFFRNYVVFPSEATWHFWSLSIEEQFYLVWPAALALIGPRRVRWFAAACMFGVAAFRFTHWQHYSAPGLSFHTEVRADALFVGCLAALLMEKIPRLPAIFTVAAAAALVFCTQHFHNEIPLVESLLIAYLMIESLRADWGVLLLKPLAGVGLVSYSIYVWQQAFALMVHHQPERLPYALLLVPVVWVSFTTLERPFMGSSRVTTVSAPNIPAPPPLVA